MKMAIPMLFLLLCLSPLKALVGEYSASANALGGITMLSQSVADHAISPLIDLSGFVATWSRPFGQKDITYYGLHNSIPLHWLNLTTGITYLAHPDYRWQDQYLSLSTGFSGITLGATPHLFYEKIDGESWYTLDGDLALSMHQAGYGAEIRWLRFLGDDAAVILSADTIFSAGASVCSTYSWRKNEADSYGVASSYRIAPALLLQSSWQSEPARFGLGCKFILGYWELMYSVRTHPELDLTHSLDIGSTW